MKTLLNTSFYIHEFVPPETYECYKENSVWFINPNIVRFVQWVKDYVGGKTVTINDWYWGGQRRYSGYRPPNCRAGAKESSHKRALGVDFIVAGYTGDELRQVIRDNFDFLHREFGLTGIELGTEPWCHADFRWTNSDKIFEIPYYKTQRDVK